MHVQRCPNCRERNDVSVYVHGQLARCARCGLRFTVERNDSPVASLPPQDPAPLLTERPTEVSFLRAESTDAPAAQPTRAPSPVPTVDQRPPSPGPRPADPLAGQAVPDIPGYECLELLGRGGMGEVWKARQKSLDRVVAIKILSPTLAVEPDFVRRFERESTALAALAHPHVVSVFDRGSANGHWYFVMEYVEGRSLRDRAADGKQAKAELLRLSAQTARAVDYAHTRGVIHRDLKPENVLVDHVGNAKVADFGLAGMSEHGRSSLTMTAVAMGTAHYMAPEQRRDAKNVDGRADLYSLGVMLYELLTNELPVGRFATPREKLPELDPRLDEMILRLLDQDPTKRPERASEVAELLERLALEPEEPVAPPASTSLNAELHTSRPPAPRQQRRDATPLSFSFVGEALRHPRKRLVVATAALLLLVIVGVSLISTRPPASEAHLRAEVTRGKEKTSNVSFGSGEEKAIHALGASWSLSDEALSFAPRAPGPHPPRAFLNSVQLNGKDAGVEADVVFAAAQTQSEGTAPAIELLLYVDEDNHLGMRLQQGEESSLSLFSSTSSKAGKQVRASELPVQLEEAETHRLQLFLLNGQVSAYVDGAKVASTLLKELGGEVRAAFGCQGECRFSNVKLRGVLDTPPSVASSKDD